MLLIVLYLLPAVRYVVGSNHNLFSGRTLRERPKPAPVNVSKVIEDLLAGYDIRLRPQFGGTCAKMRYTYTCQILRMFCRVLCC